MLTAETITDEQIRKLRDSACACARLPLGSDKHEPELDCDADTYALCWQALSRYPERDGDDARRAAARAHCAALINARASEPSK